MALDGTTTSQQTGSAQTGGDDDAADFAAPDARDTGAASAIDCSTLLTADFDDVGSPLLLATATYDGEPAAVLVLGDGDGTLAVVYSTDDCTILATQTLTAP